MHKSRLGTVVIDCRADDLDGAADFWARALDTPAATLDDPADADYRQLKMPQDQPCVLVQQVGHPSRVHLDIETDNVAAEVARLEALGAKRVEPVKRWWVMEAPTGQRFCVVRPQRSDFDERANHWL